MSPASPASRSSDLPGVVEHHQVALAQQRLQIAYVPVVETGLGRRHHQQTAGRTLGQRRLRDQLGGQVVVEVGLLQGDADCDRAARIVRPLQRSNFVDSTSEEVVRSTPSTAPIPSVSASMSPIVGTTPLPPKSQIPLTTSSLPTPALS